jgi:hypothetical protein
VWKLMSETPDDRAAVIAACGEFEKKRPGDPLTSVTRGITAWHLLQSGERKPAVQVLTRMASAAVPARPDALREAAVNMGRTWLTRLDREQVKAGLKTLYLRDVEYPESLEALKSLPGDIRPPLTDRWGKPWSYRLVGFRKLTGLANQKYELQARLLGRDSDLAEALQRPYAEGITLKPVKLVSAQAGRGVVQFTPPADASGEVILAVGAREGRVVFAYMGAKLIVLSDGNHWSVQPKPRR